MNIYSGDHIYVITIAGVLMYEGYFEHLNVWPVDSEYWSDVVFCKDDGKQHIGFLYFQDEIEVHVDIPLDF